MFPLFIYYRDYSTVSEIIIKITVYYLVNYFKKNVFVYFLNIKNRKYDEKKIIMAKMGDL